MGPAIDHSLARYATHRWPLLWCLVFGLSLSLCTVRVQSEPLNVGDRCQTPTGTNGTCLPVKNCTYVQKIIHRTDFSYYDSEYLESLKCGEAKVPGRKRTLPMFCCPMFDNTLCHMDFTERIHFGEETERGELPWAGLLFYDTGRNRTVPKCGGTLVNQRYVITAAHCTVDRPNWKLLYVRFNEFNTSSTDNCTMIDEKEICRYDYPVETIIPHPEYDMKKNSRPNDICIVRLAADVTFNNYVQPICLPLEPDVQQLPIVNATFTVTGWGETEVAIRSDVQKHVELPGLDNENCNSVYKVANVTLTEKQLCIGGLNGSDSCRGDSGGPLVREAWGDWVLVGVVSFGARVCGTENLPGVYTNIIEYLDWIEDVMFIEHYW